MSYTKTKEEIKQAPELKNTERDRIFDSQSGQKAPESKENLNDNRVGDAGQKKKERGDYKNQEEEKRIVEELNKKHAIVHTDQFYVLTEKYDPIMKGTNFSLESKLSFLNTYENQVIELDGKVKKTKGQIWIKHKERRQYNGIIFHPNPEEIKGNYYNIFRGFAVKEKAGDCTLYKEHVRKVICSGNQEYFDYVWKWKARLMQKPHEVAETALVLRGGQGIGKNTYVNALGVILGSHYLPLDSIDQFLGKFNFHMKNAVLIHGNESIWGGNKKELGKLKSMITEKHRVIEGKNKDAIVVANFTHLILSSNEDWPVHLDRDDRRFLVLEVSDRHKEDIPYFKKIDEELRNGGYEALLHELLNEDISDFDPRIIPQNIESFELKIESAPTTEKYIYEVLKAGSLDIGKVSQKYDWNGRYEIVKAILFQDYLDWCEMQKLKAQESSGKFGKAIKKLIPSVDSDKRSHRDEGRKPVYEFPELKKAREEFEKAYKIQGASEIWQ